MLVLKTARYPIDLHSGYEYVSDASCHLAASWSQSLRARGANLRPCWGRGLHAKQGQMIRHVKQHTIWSVGDDSGLRH